MRLLALSFLAVLSISYASIVPLNARADPIVVICPEFTTDPSRCLSIDIPNTNCIDFDGALASINENVGTVTLQPGTVCSFHLTFDCNDGISNTDFRSGTVTLNAMFGSMTCSG